MSVIVGLTVKPVEEPDVGNPPHGSIEHMVGVSSG